MYNIFEEEGEPMEEDAKTHFILKQVDHSDLKKSIEVLNYQMETNLSGTVSYNIPANNLITDVSELPEYVYRNRSVSSVSTEVGYQDFAYKSD